MTLRISRIAITVVVIVAGALLPAITTAVAAYTCTGVSVAPSQDLAAVVDSRPAGTTFCLEAGLYRLTRSIVTETGDTFSGQGQGVTILRGSKTISSWTASGGLYVHAGDAQQMIDTRPECASGTACQYQDGLVWNGSFLRRVLDSAPGDSTRGCPATSVPAGSFCIDYAANRMFLHDNPSSATVTYSNLDEAFANGRGTGVTTCHLTATQFATGSTQGAIGTDDGWLVGDVEISYSSSNGVKLRRQSRQLRQCEVRDEQQGER